LTAGHTLTVLAELAQGAVEVAVTPEDTDAVAARRVDGAVHSDFAGLQAEPNRRAGIPVVLLLVALLFLVLLLSANGMAVGALVGLPLRESVPFRSPHAHGAGKAGDEDVPPRNSTEEGFGKGVKPGSVHEALLHDAMPWRFWKVLRCEALSLG
jgi:hypothetical protein